MESKKRNAEEDEHPTSKRREVSIYKVGMLLVVNHPDSAYIQELGDAIFYEDATRLSSLVLWDNDKKTPFAEHLLDTLIRFCGELQHHCSHPLWEAYNWVLTAIVGTIRGSRCEEVLRLRHLSAHMELKDLVKYLKRCKLDKWLGEYRTSFVRTGLALQGFVDVVHTQAAAASSLPGTTDMIRLAQGLVEGPYDRQQGSPLRRVHVHEWLLFLQKIFQNGVQVDDHEMVVPPLNLILDVLETHSGIGRSLEGDVFCDILYSLNIVQLAKMSKVLRTAKIRLGRSWQGDDQEALEEFKLMRQDFYSSADRMSFDLKYSNTSSDKMQTVLRIVKLYMMIVLNMAREEPRHFLDEDEKTKWLTGLLEQTQHANLEDSSLRVDYDKVAAGAIKLGLLLTKNPKDYKYGVPL
ncbi:hypothetical protein SELMODRAFT_416293 [Selaginella moellendorffii]|uniref:Uncharacterized protein n=1 Tax=Selaginella moellendorffii TaxID=88036 RepID=D8RYU2_SELML|nr:hypothetical protein SELMODRAFT_416293 [Selaginella moellendorffii]